VHSDRAPTGRVIRAVQVAEHLVDELIAWGSLHPDQFNQFNGFRRRKVSSRAVSPVESVVLLCTHAGATATCSVPTPCAAATLRLLQKSGH
jgi:hypothetical protein